MADFTDKVAKAREAGYSDDEIVQFLSSGEMSAKIKKAQEAGYSSGEIVGFLGNAPQSSSEQRQVNYQDATDDPNWIKNARTLYKEVNKVDPKDDYEATTFLKDYLYDFNYRLAGSDKVGLRNTFGVASDVGSFSPEGKKAFLDAQQQFENFDVTLPGVLEAGERVLTDPTTYLGLGGGTVVKQGVKEGVKETAKQGLKRGLVRGIGTGAAEGAVYAGASDLGQQTAQVNAGGQEAIDYGQLATNTGIGAGVGGAVGGVVGGVTGLRAERNPTVQASRRIVEDPEKAVRGAEITKELADVQATREGQLGVADVNARANLRQGDLKYGVSQLKPDEATARQYNSAIDKAKALTDEETQALRSTPEGNAIAENVLYLKQMRDMTQPIMSQGGVKRVLREALDWVPGLPNKLNETIKRVALNPRTTGEEQIANAVSPRNVEIAKEVLRLQGASAATRGRQELLDAGLNMARARKLMRDTQKAQEAADRAKRQSDFEAKRAEKLNIQDANKSMRFQERMLKERAKVETAAQKAQAKAEADNIADAKRSMGFQWKMEAQKKRETGENIAGAKQEMYFQIRMAQQRAKEELQAQKALESLERAQATAKTQEERQFNKSLAGVNRVMRFRRAMERLKAAETKRAPAETISIPESGMSPGMAPKAPRGRKAAPEGMSQAERKQYANEGGDIRNQQRWEQGKATIQEYENKALEIAKDQPKDVRRALERAIADMRLAKKDQDARYKAYFDAIDAVAPYGPDALEVVDDALYFLVKKYQ